LSGFLSLVLVCLITLLLHFPSPHAFGTFFVLTVDPIGVLTASILMDFAPGTDSYAATGRNVADPLFVSRAAVKGTSSYLTHSDGYAISVGSILVLCDMKLDVRGCCRCC
jgi:hypothetical protein